MIEYIYFVKCPNCEDEPFNFFDKAKEFACSCLSQKPIITQVEVNRNDFGECTDSADLGTVWSWEDMMSDTEKEHADKPSLLTKDFLNTVETDTDPEFDALDNSIEAEDDDFRAINNEELYEAFIGRLCSESDEIDMIEFTELCKEIGIETVADLERFAKDEADREGTLLDKLKSYRAELGADFKITNEACRKPIPEGMTIEQLVEEMEENEDEVECTWCNDLFPKSECRYEVDLGYLCSRCEAAIKSRGETLTFRENNYFDYLDESTAVADSTAVGKKVRLLNYESNNDAALHELKRLLRTSEDVRLSPTQINLIVKYDNSCPVVRETNKAFLVRIPCYYRNREDHSKINDDPTYVYCWVPKSQVAFVEEVDPLDHHNPDYDEDKVADYIADQTDKAWDSRYDNAIDDFFNEDFSDPVDFEDEEAEEEPEESIFDSVESVEEVVDILVKDEEEAIAAYEEAADKIEELTSEEDIEETKEILDHIKEEEEEHIEELTSLVDTKEDEVIEVENDPISDEAEEPLEENAQRNGGFRTDGYRTVYACYDSDDFDINVEFGMQNEDEYEVEDQLYLLCPGQTVADLVVYLSRECGFTNVYVHTETSADKNEIKTASRFTTVPGDHDYRHYGTIQDRLVEDINDHAEPIESEQKLEGTDNAVVDCKVAKVVTHSEDETPVDCKGEKKPLEKSLTEALMIDCPECGGKKCLDQESGVCNNCGFII